MPSTVLGIVNTEMNKTEYLPSWNLHSTRELIKKSVQ